MKRFLLFILFLIFCSGVFSKELEGPDLSCVHKALDAKLKYNAYDSLDEKLAFLKEELTQIEKSEAGSEAKLIASSLLKIEMESAKTSEALKILKESEKGKKSKKKVSQEELNPNAREIIFDCFENYKTFAENNSDLSTYFYFHYNETMYATVPYLSKKEQLKMMTGMPDDYKKLEERNPDFAETLNMYGAVLYFLPAAFGGNKKLGEEKIRKAIEVSACDYEKANALVLYAQFLVEKKDTENALAYVDQALALDPENKFILKIRDANKAGFSIFKMDDYEKTLEKESL